MKREEAKTPSQSTAETRYLVIPEHTSFYRTAFGRVVMAWIDRPSCRNMPKDGEPPEV